MGPWALLLGYSARGWWFCLTVCLECMCSAIWSCAVEELWAGRNLGGRVASQPRGPDGALCAVRYADLPPQPLQAGALGT